MNKKNKILLSVALITTGLLTSCNHQFYSSNTANNPAITTSNIDSNTKPISMKINGLKENYGLGSLIDLSNLIVVVSFDNNTTKEFSMYNANITYDSFDTDTLGLHKIKIKYNDFEQEFEYNVKNINLTLDFNGGLFDGKNTYELPARKNIVSLEGIIPSLNEEGKKFAGWFYDKDLTNRVEFAIQNELSINDDITIYAGYDNDYTSIFDYEVINNEVRLIKLKYENIVNEIQIPKTIDLYPVTIIGENFAYIDDPWACDEIDTIKFDQDSCVKIIENNAFYDLSQLVNCSLPDTIEKIGDYAFFCTQIKTLILPKNLKSIGNYAFAFCINLENVYFNESNLISIGNYAFSYCSELNEFEFSNKLEIIGTNAFENCIKFKKINLPASLETVGLNTFSGLPNLEAINVDKNNKKFKSIDGNLYSYDETIFYRYSYGKKDKEFIMPSNVKFIYDGAFNVYNEIIYLENLVLNEGLIEIGDLVFENTKIDFTIPSTVNFIGQKAFYGWNGKEFKISPNNKKYGVLNKSLVCYKESDGKKTCMLYAIPGGYEDDNYILNENIEKIDSYVCSTLNISSFIIPVDSKLNEIEDNALNLTAFPNLKYLYIKKKVPFKIYNDSFYYENYKLNDSFSIIISNLDDYNKEWKDIKFKDDDKTLIELYVKSLNDYIEYIVRNISNGIASTSYDRYIEFKEFLSYFDYKKDYYQLISVYKNLLSLFDFSNALYPETLEYIQRLILDIIDSAVDLYKDLDNSELLTPEINYSKFYSCYIKTPDNIKNKISTENKNLINEKYKIYLNLNEQNEIIKNELLNFEYSTNSFDIDKYNDIKRRMKESKYDTIKMTENLLKAYNMLELQNLLYLFNTTEYNLDNFYYLSKIYYGNYSDYKYFYGIDFYISNYIDSKEASKLYGYDKLDDNLNKLESLEENLTSLISSKFNEEEPTIYDKDFYLDKINCFEKIYNNSLTQELQMKYRLYKLRYYLNELINSSINPLTNKFYTTDEMTDDILYNLSLCVFNYTMYNSNSLDNSNVFEMIENYKSNLYEFENLKNVISIYNNKYAEIEELRNTDNEDFSIENALNSYKKYYNYINSLGQSGFYLAMIVVEKINSLKGVTLTSDNYSFLFYQIEKEINPIYNEYSSNYYFNLMFYKIIDEDAYNNYIKLSNQL